MEKLTLLLVREKFVIEIPSHLAGVPVANAAKATITTIDRRFMSAPSEKTEGMERESLR